MATLRDIKRRIRAVKNTRQITKAMKMVAAAKLRKVQGRMLELRPYADKMRDIISNLAKSSDKELHPLLSVRPRKNVCVLVMTSDRGLCGAYNTNIMKSAVRFINDLKSQGFEPAICTVGKKAREYFKRRNVEIGKSWTGFSGKLSFPNAQEVAKFFMESFTNEEFDEVHLVYNEFVSVIAQKQVNVRLLPVAPLAEEEGEVADLIYEPSEKDLLNRLLPKNVEIQVYRAFLEAQASEEAARMTAMENASKNANEMIDRLTLVANKVRQATITRELMDIVGGAEAIKS